MIVAGVAGRGPGPGLDSLGLEGIDAIVFRTVGDRPSLRESLLPRRCSGCRRSAAAGPNRKSTFVAGPTGRKARSTTSRDDTAGVATASPGDPDGPPRTAAEAAWHAVTSSIAGTAHVRISADGGRTHPARHARPLPAGPPSQPCTVPVYDPGTGTSRMLALDLYPVRGRSAADRAAQVSAAACAIARLVTRLGGRCISNVAPGGGRHVYVLLAAPLPWRELRDLARAMAVRFPAVDVVPMSSPGGQISPPGSRHESGGSRTLTSPLADARGATEQPNGPQVWNGLLTEFAAELRQAETGGRAADLDVAELDDASVPWIPRLGGRAPGFRLRPGPGEQGAGGPCPRGEPEPEPGPEPVSGAGAGGPAGGDGVPGPGWPLVAEEVFRSRYAGAMLLHAFFARADAGSVLAGAAAGPGRAAGPGLAAGGCGAAVCGEHVLGARRGDHGAVQAPGRRRAGAAGRAGDAAGAAGTAQALAQIADAADPLNVQALFASAMLAADPVTSGVYYVDDHFVPYTGANRWPGLEQQAGPGRAGPRGHARDRARRTGGVLRDRRALRAEPDLAAGAGRAEESSRDRHGDHARVRPRRRLPAGIQPLPRRARALGHLPARPPGGPGDAAGHHHHHRPPAAPGRSPGPRKRCRSRTTAKPGRSPCSSTARSPCRSSPRTLTRARRRSCPGSNPGGGRRTSSSTPQPTTG